MTAEVKNSESLSRFFAYNSGMFENIKTKIQTFFEKNIKLLIPLAILCFLLSLVLIPTGIWYGLDVYGKKLDYKIVDLSGAIPNYTHCYELEEDSNYEIHVTVRSFLADSDISATIEFYLDGSLEKTKNLYTALPEDDSSNLKATADFFITPKVGQTLNISIKNMTAEEWLIEIYKDVPLMVNIGVVVSGIIAVSGIVIGLMGFYFILKRKEILNETT